MKNKLQIKFLLWFVLFSLIPLMIMSYSSFSLVRMVLESESQHRLRFVEKILSEKIDSFYQFHEKEAGQFRDRAFFPLYSAYLNQKISKQNILKLIETRIHEKSEDYSLLTMDIFSRKLKFIFNPLKDERLIKYVQKYRDDQPVLTPVFSKKPKIQYLIVPLYSEKDRILILIMRIRFEQLEGIFQSILKYDNNLNYILLSSSSFVYSSIREINEKSYSSIQFEDDRIILGDSGFLIRNVAFPRYKLFLNLMLAQNENQMFLNMLKKRYVLGLGLFLMLLAGFGYFVSRKVAQSMRQLIQITKEIGEGNLDANVDIQTGDEFEELAGNIVEMKEKLRHYNNLLEHEVVLRTEELQSARRQIQHQEKMINLGMLAAGVAHEIGNPLTSISNLTQLLLRKIGSEKERTYLELMKKNIERISEIVEDLVNFSRPSQDRFEVVSINQVVEQAVKIVKFDKKGKRIKYITLLDEKNPKAEVIEGQLLQVLVNLLFNALDAVELEKGIITITTALQGDFVSIKVADNGEGIPKHLHEKIFEPFFTTKEVGKGTGLGLSVSYTIIKNFNGNIILRSEPGMGTEFEIILPVKQKENVKNESKITHS